MGNQKDFSDPAEMKRMREMAALYCDGHTMGSIGKVYGLSTHAVQYRLYKMRVKLRRRGRKAISLQGCMDD
jgi:hypothetical protein